MFSSAMDQERRELTGRITVGRLVLGLLRSLAIFLLLPVFLIKVYAEEHRHDRLTTGENHVDASDDLESYIICVIPLAEFGRMGAPISSVPNADNRFVLMQHVAYDLNRTRPVGESIDPDATLPIESHPHLRIVSGGFITDFASIPFLLRKMVGAPLGSYSRAAVVHDWAYANHFDGTSAGRRQCDQAMLALMRDDATGPLRRTLIYLGLRIGGGMAFREAPHNQTQLVHLYSDERFRYWYQNANEMLLTYLSRQFEVAGILESGWTAKTLEQIQAAGEDRK